MFFKYGSKSASHLAVVPQSHPLLVKYAAQHALDPRANFYLEDWAVSAFEKWGPNENWDGFEDAELKVAYPTFRGSMVCFDHQNWDPNLAVGANIDGVYTDELYVKVLMAIDRAKAEARIPGIERKIESGLITDTSMGAWCKVSVCNACENVATSPENFCDHITMPLRGTMVRDASTGWKEVRACELNRGVVFFENSIITLSDGADGNAKILAKLASSSRNRLVRCANGSIFVPGDLLFSAVEQIGKEASSEQEHMLIARIMSRLSTILNEEGV